MAFSTLLKLCSHNLHRFSHHFYHFTPKQTLYSLNDHSFPPFLLGLDNHQSRFCLVDLPLLDIPYTWNRTVCGLLCPSFSKHSVCRAHIHCPVYQLFILFEADTLSYGYATLCLFIRELMNIWTASTSWLL